jgi:ubiquinone/menaquinone biosynthesis C-methylase UbiE
MDAVSRNSRVLDVGCGAGRLAFGLIGAFGDEISYHGVDVMEEPIQWCRRHISATHPGFTFTRIDVSNERYNPDGALIAAAASLPFAPRSFDLVYAYSVLSHMTGADVAPYLRDFRRVLDRDGTVVVTAFVEDGVEAEAVNPPGYGPIAWSGDLHCVRFSRERFQEFLRDADLRIEIEEHGTETDGQSRFVLVAAER